MVRIHEQVFAEHCTSRMLRRGRAQNDEGEFTAGAEEQELSKAAA